MPGQARSRGGTVDDTNPALSNTYIYIYVYMHACMHAYIHIYIYTHTHIYIYVYNMYTRIYTALRTTIPLVSVNEVMQHFSHRRYGG